MTTTTIENCSRQHMVRPLDEHGFVRLNRTCSRSTSAWCQFGNGLRIVNGGSGQWKRLRSRLGMLLMMMMMTRSRSMWSNI